jgi:hypothetical protein
MPNYAYRQLLPASCGAACLMCGALELGTKWIEPQPTWGPLWQVRAPMACNQATEMRLYSVTSGDGGAIPHPGSGYSLPSYIYEVALALGLDASAFVDTNMVGTALRWLYKTELGRAQGLGMLIHEQPPRKPSQNERLLRVVRTGPDSWYIPAAALHWIMERPDGSIMEPAGFAGGHGPGQGWEIQSLNILLAARKSQGVAYFDTGIGIMVRQGGGGDIDAAAMTRLFG